MKILIATLAYNNANLLEECVESWPRNIDRCVLFQGNKPEMNKTFENIIYPTDLTFSIKRINNWGVAGGWNIILREAFNYQKYDGVILVGSDTKMLPGFYESFIKGLQFYDFVESTHKFNCFYISKNCFKTVGSFDENFYPAYCEDDDYRIRVIKSGVRYKKDHGNHDLFMHVGSASVKSLKGIEQVRAYKSFKLNKDYMHRKWGGTENSIPKWKPVFHYPFNCGFSWELGDWQLEPQNRIARLWDNIYIDPNDDRLATLIGALQGEGFYNSDT